jgi:hypothetical protein
MFLASEMQYFTEFMAKIEHQWPSILEMEVVDGVEFR